MYIMLNSAITFRAEPSVTGYLPSNWYSLRSLTTLIFSGSIERGFVAISSGLVDA